MNTSYDVDSKADQIIAAIRARKNKNAAVSVVAEAVGERTIYHVDIEGEDVQRFKEHIKVMEDIKAIRPKLTLENLKAAFTKSTTADYDRAMAIVKP